MEVREGLLYSREHVWMKEEDGTVTAGITDYAQSELKGLVFVNLPEEGDAVTAGVPFADVESVKTVSDVYAPVTGTVAEVNEELADDPELINESPYEAWFVRITDVTDRMELLTAGEYAEFVEGIQGQD